MRKVGITGQSGFIGSYLFNSLGLYPGKFERVNFEKSFFEDENQLNLFVSQCDVIVHLAAMNRHPDQDIIYQTNIDLTGRLITALERTKSKAHLIFASSTQEFNENHYGRSKKEGRHALADWAAAAGGKFSGLIIPNVFGPFGQPFHNSVVATFCHQLLNGQTPSIMVDAKLKLIYVGELAERIIDVISSNIVTDSLEIAYTSERNVTEILSLLEHFKETYFEKGNIPALPGSFEVTLFNTFRSYMDIANTFPVKLKKHIDPRGAFSEIVRLGVGGQVSFSVTLPAMKRGDHFHTRKIERFTVMKGSARIQLRKIGTDTVMDFDLSGDEPAYVDMPVWYTHNITNTGTDDLYTIFWINEPYNNADADTFYETV